jgi:hypothetical protein
VSAYRTRDGTRLWTRPRRDDLVSAGHVELAGKTGYVDHGTVGANGELVYPIAFPDESESFFIALDPQTGVTLWRAPFPWGYWEIQSDEAGQLYVQIAYGNGIELAAYRADGGPAWQTSEIVGPTYGGRAFGRGAALSAATGQVEYSFSSNVAGPPDVVLPHLGVRRDDMFHMLQTFDPADGGLFGQLVDPNVDWWAIFASADDELMAVDAQTPALRGFSFDATQTFSCEIPVTPAQLQTSQGLPTLVPGLLLLWTTDPAGEDMSPGNTLHAYAVPGRSGASQGWISPGGSMSRANKPR